MALSDPAEYSGHDLFDRADLMGDWYERFTHIEEVRINLVSDSDRYKRLRRYY